MTPTPPNPPAAGHYLPPAELAHLILAYQHRGRATDALGLALMKIAGGVWARYRFTAEPEEFISECLVHFLDNVLHKIDVRSNPFSYLTTCAIRLGWKLRDRDNARRRKARAYVAAAVQAHQLGIGADELAPDDWAASAASRRRLERQFTAEGAEKRFTAEGAEGAEKKTG